MDTKQFLLQHGTLRQLESLCSKVSFKNDVDQKNIMSYQEDSFRTESDHRSQQRLQMIDTLKFPITEMGYNLGYEAVEDSNLVAGPIHACCTFMLGSEYLRGMRLDLYAAREMEEDG